jgi:hypothetical protein
MLKIQWSESHVIKREFYYGTVGNVNMNFLITLQQFNESKTLITKLNNIPQITQDSPLKRCQSTPPFIIFSYLNDHDLDDV